MIDEETAIVMCYTGWAQGMARGAIVQWRRALPDWDATYMKQYLSAQSLEKLKRLTTEANKVMLEANGD